MAHLIIGTAGHVDHGKTALVKALTNIDCDTHKEEKERGITINLGFSHLDLPTGDSIGIVDVPGHKDFIKTMVAGAYGIDIAMLVIAADSGIMPQTEEHIRILEMLGVEHGIVVINKADLVDRETLEFAELEITEYLEGTSLEKAPVVAVSAISGLGMDQLMTTITGIIPRVGEKEIGDTFRMYIDRIFNVKGLGYVVTGSVLEGSVRSGQDLFLLPGKGKKVKVRNIQRHGHSVDWVVRGDRAALNLAGLKAEDYTRGMVLCSKQLGDTQLIDATVKVFDPSSLVPVWSNVLFISGTYETSARMHLLDKDELHPEDTGLVQLYLSKQAVLSARDRFILRNSSNDITLGGGTIIDTNPLHHRKRTEKLIRNLNDLMEATLHSESIVNLAKIELNKMNGPVFASTVEATLKTPFNSLVEELKASPSGSILMFETGSQHILIDATLDQHYKKQVLSELKLHHQRYPILNEGLETNEFTGKFGFGKNEAGRLYLEILMEGLCDEGLIRKQQNSWVMPDHLVQIDNKTQSELDWVEDLFRKPGMDIPNIKEIEDSIHHRKINKDRFKMYLKYLTDEGRLIYHEGVYFHYEIIGKAQKELLEIISKKEDGINEKEFREMIGGTRKFIQAALGIFLNWGIVIKPTFYILITEKGRMITKT